MKQIEQGLQSTKPKRNIPTFSPLPGIKHHDVYLCVLDATKKTMYTDQTGHFPIISHVGQKYIMVAVEQDRNYIDCEPMRDRTTKSLIAAYQDILNHWKQTRVIAPNWHRLDN